MRIRKIIAIFLGTAALALLAGCNTPFSYPTIWGKEDIHLIFDISIDNQSNQVDFTSRLNDGASDSLFFQFFL